MLSNTSQHQDADLASPEEIEAASILSRLAHRSRMEPITCRAARLLQSNPALSIRRLASQLGVSEAYLSRGLRTILDTDPNRLARIATTQRHREIVNPTTHAKYILGHSQDEIRRLSEAKP